MELRLGRFGDRRLEKGGPFFWVGLSGLAGEGCGFAALVATVRAKSGLRAFCAMRR